MVFTREVDVSPNTWIEWYQNTLRESFRYVSRDAQSCLVVSVPRKEMRRIMKGCHQSFSFMWESHLRERRYEVKAENEYPAVFGDPDSCDGT